MNPDNHNNNKYNITPRKIDFCYERRNRQKNNNKKVFDAIKSNDTKSFYKNINNDELNRVLVEVDMPVEELIAMCSKDDIINKILSGRIAINSSRQGITDEKLQMQVCNDTCSQFGIYIKNLSSTAFRPVKGVGKIVSKSQMKIQGILKDKCLKSFDGKISGKIDGWIFAKVCMGNGGHQGNVMEELDKYCDWVKKYQPNSSTLYVILWDTNDESAYDTLKNKYKNVKNIMITNHFEFQKYIIENYSVSNN